MTYEYICTACHHEWEAEQPITAKPLEDCPSCEKKTAKRQVSGGAGFILKGGGWYSDGYTSKKVPSQSGSSGDESGSKPPKAASKESTEASAPKTTEGPKGPSSTAAAA
jgi:putative FmdB family regulatory protein